MPPREEQNPYPKGTQEWYNWENEYTGGQNATTTNKPSVGKENGTLSAQPEMPVTATPTPATPAPKYTGYGDIIELMTSRQKKAEDAAEQARRDARRARTQKVVGGIADLGRAFTNLFATAQYAPNAYDPKQSMSEKAQERYDKALADYEERQEQALNYALNKAKYEAADNAAEYERWKDAEDMKRADRREQRLRDEQEFRRQKETWKQDFEQSKMEQKEKLAIMNADLKKWTERLKMSRSEVAHTLAGYTIDEYQYIDSKGQIHKVKTRSVYNPNTGNIEAGQPTDEVVSRQVGGQQTSQQTQSGSQSAPYRTNNSTSIAPYVKQN